MRSDTKELQDKRKPRLDTHMTIRISRELRDDARYYCWWHRMKVSDIVRQALNSFVEEQEELRREAEASNQEDQVSPGRYYYRRATRDPHNTQLTIRMSADMHKRVHDCCWWARTQVSDVVREALETFVKEKDELYRAARQETQV